jgi:curli biogenesis system outer membrane secretion channel CsgG
VRLYFNGKSNQEKDKNMTHRLLNRGLALLLLTSVLSFANSASAQGRARVALLDFENKAGISRNVTDTLVNMITETLVKANKFELIERSQLGKVTDEQLLGASGAVDAASAAQIGKLTGADYLLMGTVTEAGAGTTRTRVGDVQTARTVSTLAVDVQFVDATTGVIKFAETFKRSVESVQVGSTSSHFDINRGDAGMLARRVIRELTRKVLETIYPPQVMKYTADTGEAILNYGGTMFAVGEKWTIIHRGEELIDPATGEVLDFDEEVTRHQS